MGSKLKGEGFLNDNHCVSTEHPHNILKKVGIITIVIAEQKFGKIKQFFQSLQIEDKWIRNLNPGLPTLLHYASFHK